MIIPASPGFFLALYKAPNDEQGGVSLFEQHPIIAWDVIETPAERNPITPLVATNSWEPEDTVIMYPGGNVVDVNGEAFPGLQGYKNRREPPRSR